MNAVEQLMQRIKDLEATVEKVVARQVALERNLNLAIAQGIVKFIQEAEKISQTDRGSIEFMKFDPEVHDAEQSLFIHHVAGQLSFFSVDGEPAAGIPEDSYLYAQAKAYIESNNTVEPGTPHQVVIIRRLPSEEPANEPQN